MKESSTTRKYLHNLVFILSNILFPIISFSYAARVLGPVGIGKAQIVLNLTQYFILIAALGIPVYGVREIARATGDPHRLSKTFSELVVINLITTLILIGLYLGLVLFTGWFRESRDLYLVGGISILAGFLTIDWFFSGLEQFEFLSLRSVIVKTVGLAGLVLLVRDETDVILYLAINVLVTLITNMWNVLRMQKSIRFHLVHLNIRRHIPGLITLFLITATVSVYAVGDTLLVGYLAGEKSAGLYTAALKINKLVIPLIVSMGIVLTPRITVSLANQDSPLVQNLADTSFRFICLTGIPVTLGLLAFAPEVMVCFTGSGFSDAIPAMQITAALPILIGLGHLFGLQLLVSGGYEKKYLIATSLGMILSILLNLLLIPGMRENGAAIANVATEILVTLVSIWFAYRLFTIRLDWSLALKTGLGCLLFLPMAILLRLFITEPAFRLVTGAVSCTGLYLVMQLLIIREPKFREFLLGVGQKLWRTDG